MKIRLLKSVCALIAVTAILIPTTITAIAAGTGADETQNVSVYINGQEEEKISAKIINSLTYVPIREFAIAMGARSVYRDGLTTVVQATGLKINAEAGDKYIEANGRYLFADSQTTSIRGTLYVPIRLLTKAFGAYIRWDEHKNAVFIIKGTAAIKPAEEAYSQEDVTWLSKIIFAEARGESLEGKIAVGNVILNRVESPQFPNSVYKVIFDKRSGVQFTPAYSGAINNRSSEECVIAAKIALDGGNTAGTSLYFSQADMGCWAKRNRPYVATIGNHSFYA